MQQQLTSSLLHCNVHSTAIYFPAQLVTTLSITSNVLISTDCGEAVMAGSTSPDIILLGEHTLVVLNSQGQLRWQKRFDYQPVAFTTYPVSVPIDCLTS